PEVLFRALAEALGPVVDRAAADAQQVGDAVGGLPGGEPQQRLQAALFAGVGPGSEELLQLLTFLVAELERNHGLTVVAPQVIQRPIVLVQELFATYLDGCASTLSERKSRSRLALVIPFRLTGQWAWDSHRRSTPERAGTGSNRPGDSGERRCPLPFPFPF